MKVRTSRADDNRATILPSPDAYDAIVEVVVVVGVLVVVVVVICVFAVMAIATIEPVSVAVESAIFTQVTETELANSVSVLELIELAI